MHEDSDQQDLVLTSLLEFGSSTRPDTEVRPGDMITTVNGIEHGGEDLLSMIQDVSQLRSEASGLLAHASIRGRLDAVLACVESDAAPQQDALQSLSEARDLLELQQDVSQLHSEAGGLLAQGSFDGRLEGVLAGVNGDAALRLDVLLLRSEARDLLAPPDVSQLRSEARGSQRGGSQQRGPFQCDSQQDGSQHGGSQQSGSSQRGSEQVGSQRGRSQQCGSSPGGSQRGGSQLGGVSLGRLQQGGAPRSGSQLDVSPDVCSHITKSLWLADPQRRRQACEAAGTSHAGWLYDAPRIKVDAMAKRIVACGPGAVEAALWILARK